MVTTNLNSPMNSADMALIVDPPRNVDRYAQLALGDTETEYLGRYPQAKTTIVSRGLSGVVAQVSDRLNATTDLDSTVRLLLSCSNIYAAMAEMAIVNENATDANGIHNAVLRYVSDRPKRFFQAKILDCILQVKHVTIAIADVKWEMLPVLVAQQGISIVAGEVEPAVTALLETIYTRGELHYYLERYIGRGELDPTIFTPEFRQRMLDRLVGFGLQIDAAKFEAGAYDEYFALAYSDASQSGSTTQDPIDLVYRRGSQSTWDFTVDRFESVEKQSVSRNNIMAAGVLDYNYYIGEVMRVFDVANALVLRWASGLLDIPTGTTASALYRFHKRRLERSTPEERAMLYKRVLDKGDGEVLSRMTVNTAFSALWDQLISEVMKYIYKTERKAYWSSWSNSGVSNSRIYQVTKDLQYNLTDYMTGMAHLQATEDYNHLQEAIAIIGSTDVRNYFGGPRQSLWNTLERIAQEEFGETPDTETIKNLAVEGNKIFEWIANFDENTVTAVQFDNLLAAVETWALAQSTLKNGRGRQRPLPALTPRSNDGFNDFNNFDGFNDNRNPMAPDFVAYDSFGGADFQNAEVGIDNFSSGLSAGGDDDFDRW